MLSIYLAFLISAAGLSNPVIGDKVILDFSLDRDKIHAGAPLAIVVTARALATDVRSAFLQHRDVFLLITDSSGKEVCFSGSRAYSGRENRADWTLFALEGRDMMQQKLAFQEWCSTDIAPGIYTVTLDRKEASFGPFTSSTEGGDFTRNDKQGDAPSGLSFSLEIVPSDEAAVRREYEALMSVAKARAEGGVARDARFHAVSQIVYAQTPIAIPYQMRLFGLEVPNRQRQYELSHALYLARYFATLNDAEIARAVVGVFEQFLAEGAEMDKWNWAKRAVLWCIHDLHEQGKPEVVRWTQPVVSEFSRPSIYPFFLDPRGHFKPTPAN